MLDRLDLSQLSLLTVWCAISCQVAWFHPQTQPLVRIENLLTEVARGLIEESTVCRANIPIEFCVLHILLTNSSRTHNLVMVKATLMNTTSTSFSQELEEYHNFATNSRNTIEQDLDEKKIMVKYYRLDVKSCHATCTDCKRDTIFSESGNC